MKKVFFLSKSGILAMLGITALLVSSCTQNESMLPEANDKDQTVQVSFDVRVPEAQTRAISGTEDEASLSRYICEVYEKNENGLIASSRQRIEQAGTSFSFSLKKKTTYTLLLWADKGTPDGADNYYVTANLQNVSIQEQKATSAGQVAYYANKEVSITAATSIGTISLIHAVAKVAYNNTQDFVSESNTLKVTYKEMIGTFNVATGVYAFSELSADVIHTFSGIAKTTGVIATDYIFAPAEKKLITLNFQFNTEDEQSLPNVPLQSNYSTTVSGTFSNSYEAAFTVSQSVENMGEKDDQNF